MGVKCFERYSTIKYTLKIGPVLSNESISEEMDELIYLKVLLEDSMIVVEVISIKIGIITRKICGIYILSVVYNVRFSEKYCVIFTSGHIFLRKKHSIMRRLIILPLVPLDTNHFPFFDTPNQYFLFFSYWKRIIWLYFILNTDSSYAINPIKWGRLHFLPPY